MVATGMIGDGLPTSNVPVVEFYFAMDFIRIHITMADVILLLPQCGAQPSGP